jgi:hypothetical protein
MLKLVAGAKNIRRSPPESMVPSIFWEMLCCADVGLRVLKFCGGFGPFGALSAACDLSLEYLCGLLEMAALESGGMLEGVRVGKTWKQLELILSRHTEQFALLGLCVDVESCLRVLAGMRITPPCRPWFFAAVDAWLRRRRWRIQEETGMCLPSNWEKLEVGRTTDDPWEDWAAACCGDDPEKEPPPNVMELVAAVVQNVVAI